MKIIIIFIIMFILAGCGKTISEDHNVKRDLFLTDTQRDRIRELAEVEAYLYSLSSLVLESSAIEIQLYLHFTPLTHEEVMIFTDPFAARVAEMFDYEIAVNVAAVHDVEGLGKNRIIGESMFSPHTGKVTYRHFGRDHDMRHGDP